MEYLQAIASRPPKEQCECRAYGTAKRRSSDTPVRILRDPTHIVNNAKRIFRFPDDRHHPLKTLGAKRTFAVKSASIEVMDEKAKKRVALHRKYVEETCELEGHPTRVKEVITGEWAADEALAHISLELVAQYTEGRWIRELMEEPAEAKDLFRYKTRCSMCSLERTPS